jgi:hypothetical protein
MIKEIKRTKIKKQRRGWRFSSVEERLPGKCKALSSVPSTEKKKGKNRKKKQNKKDKKKKMYLRIKMRFSSRKMWKENISFYFSTESNSK